MSKMHDYDYGDRTYEEMNENRGFYLLRESTDRPTSRWAVGIKYEGVDMPMLLRCRNEAAATYLWAILLHSVN